MLELRMDFDLSTDCILTKVWLKSFGWRKSDDWWVVPSSYATTEFKKILKWELEDSQWSVSKHSGAINILIDWDGLITNLFEDVDCLRSVLDKVGLVTMGEGWAPLSNLTHDERFKIMHFLPEYQSMISR